MQKENLALDFNKSKIQGIITKLEHDGDETGNMQQHTRHENKGKKPKVKKEATHLDDTVILAGCRKCYLFLMLFKTMEACPFCNKETIFFI